MTLKYPLVRVLQVATICVFIAMRAYFMPQRTAGEFCGNCMYMAVRDLWYLSALPTGIIAASFALFIGLKEKRFVGLFSTAALGAILLILLLSFVIYGQPVKHNSELDVVAAWLGYFWWLLVFAAGAVGKPFFVSRFLEPTTGRMFRITLSLVHVLGLLYVLNNLWWRMRLDLIFLPTTACT